MESLSIATAVVQFIDFAGLLIKVGRLVWEGQGVPDALDAHAYSQNVLDNVKRMRGYLTNDSDFQKLVDRCEVLAKEIALMFPKSLAKTQSKPKRVLKAGAATLRHVWHKSDFDEKLERLNILSGALRDRIAGEDMKQARRQRDHNHQVQLNSLRTILEKMNQDRRLMQIVLSTIIIAFIAAVLSLHLRLRSGFGAQEKHHQDDHHDRVLKWLTPIDNSQIQRTVYSSRAPGTSEWLSQNQRYRSWINSPKSEPIWLRGIPGSGKTVLASVVIDELQRRSFSPGHVVSFSYLDHQQESQQTPEILVSGILKDVFRSRSITPALSKLYEASKEKNTSPKLEELVDILKAECEELDALFVIIDALDEISTSASQRERFLTQLHGLSSRAKLFFTSRPDVELERWFPGISILNVEASSRDIQRYTEYRLTSQRFARLIDGDKDLEAALVGIIVQESQGMFLLPELHLNLLEDQANKRALRATLGTLPPNLGTAFDDTIARINAQSTQQRQTAHRVLQWLVYAFQPLTVKELQQAFAVQNGDTELDLEGTIPPSYFLEVCKGLVVIDPEPVAILHHISAGVRDSVIEDTKHWKASLKSPRIRLAHLSVLEYLKQNELFEAVAVHTDMAVTSLSYLSFDVFDTWDLSWGPLDAGYLFLPYASIFWTDHARGEPEKFLANATRRFLQNDGNVFTSTRFRSHQAIFDRRMRVPFRQNFTDSGQSLSPYKSSPNLPLLADGGLVKIIGNLMPELLQKDFRDQDTMSAAFERAIFRHETSVLGLLLQATTDAVFLEDILSQGLAYAIALGDSDTVNMLLQAGAAQVRSALPLCIAVHKGWLEVANILLDQIPVQELNLANCSDGYLAFCSRGAGSLCAVPDIKESLDFTVGLIDVGLSDKLLSSWAKHTGTYNVTPLLLAVLQKDGDRIGVIEALLQNGADVNAPSHFGTSTRAPMNETESLTMNPIHAAIYACHVEALQVLASRPSVDVEATLDGITALNFLIRRSSIPGMASWSYTIGQYQEIRLQDQRHSLQCDEGYDIAMFDILFDKGATLGPAQEPTSLIEECAMAGNITLARHLLDRGLASNTTELSSALTKSVGKEHSAMVDLLLASGAQSSPEALAAAGQACNIRLFMKLLSQNFIQDVLRFPLFCAPKLKSDAVTALKMAPSTLYQRYLDLLFHIYIINFEALPRSMFGEDMHSISVWQRIQVGFVFGVFMLIPLTVVLGTVLTLRRLLREKSAKPNRIVAGQWRLLGLLLSSLSLVCLWCLIDILRRIIGSNRE